MEVILLERVGKLGQMGDVVRVKDGFGRNFLLAKGKALRATKENKARFEGMKAELEKRNLEAKGDAGKLASKLEGKTVRVLRQASETGQLYGSVSPRDLAGLLSVDGLTVNRAQVSLQAPIKAIGQYKVPIALHPEIEVVVTVIVARSAEEAERVARGENVTVRREEGEEGEDAAAAAAEAAAAFFEQDAGEKEGGENQASGEKSAAEAKPAKEKPAKEKSAKEKPAREKKKKETEE